MNIGSVGRCFGGRLVGESVSKWSMVGWSVVGRSVVGGFNKTQIKLNGKRICATNSKVIKVIHN